MDFGVCQEFFQTFFKLFFLRGRGCYVHSHPRVHAPRLPRCPQPLLEQLYYSRIFTSRQALFRKNTVYIVVRTNRGPARIVRTNRSVLQTCRIYIRVLLANPIHITFQSILRR